MLRKGSSGAFNRPYGTGLKTASSAWIGIDIKAEVDPELFLKQQQVVALKSGVL